MITCSFEDGHKFNFRHVTATAIVLNKEQDQILLARRSEKTHDEQGKFCTPGGYLDRGETLKSGLMREVQEETGYEVEPLKLLLIVDNPSRKGTDRQNVEFVFLVEATAKVGNPDWETSEVKWFALDELPSPDEIAFDHQDFIDLYLKYRKEPFELPYFKSN
jgi:ADP-ribose pyrophosphatase YjhB (NUDIX family)